MRKIKYLTLLLMINLALLLALNYNVIIAFAESLYPEDLKIGMKYEKGEEVIFTPQPPSYVRKDAIYIAYIDENQELLSMFYNGDQYGDSINIKIGTPYSDNYYNNLEEQNELYGLRNDELTEIDSWILYEKSSIKEYCEKYSDEISNSKRCADLEENNEYKSVYVFREYKEPAFSFTCDPSTLKYGEVTTCTLSGQSDDIITKIKVNFVNSEYLDVTKMEEVDGWTYEYNKESDELSFVSEAGVKGAFKVMGIKLTSNINQHKNTAVEIKNIVYETIDGEEKTIDLKSDLELVATGQETTATENPNTRDLNILLLLSFVILSTIIIVSLRKKVQN